MKIKFTVAAALILCACTPVKTDLEKYALNCKAKEIVLQSDTLELPYRVVFNSLGQADSVITYNFDQSFRYLETYTYNGKHQVTQISGLNADNEDEARYEYDYKGRFISECRMYGMNNQEGSRKRRPAHSEDRLLCRRGVVIRFQQRILRKDIRREELFGRRRLSRERRRGFSDGR